MPSQGPRSPAAATSLVPSVMAPWIGPTNVFSSNDVRATVQLAAGQASDILAATNFGFTDLIGFTIRGIELRVERIATVDTEISDLDVGLTKDGTNYSGNTQLGGYYGTIETTWTFGGPTHLWGIAWTPAEIMAPTFGALIRAENRVGPTQEAQIDHVTITVYFDTDGIVLQRRTKRRTARDLSLDFRQPHDW